MLSKEQADTIAKALLEQQRADAIAGRNAHSAPIPRYYRSLNFGKLGPHKQAEFVRQAEESAAVRIPMGILALVLVSLGGLAWYITPTTLKSPILLAIAFLFFASSLVPTHLARPSYIKKAIGSPTVRFMSVWRVWPNPSLKRSANGMSRWPSSAGPAAHFALAVQRAIPSSPA